MEFIQNLDAQKDEAVQRTFDQVSEYFSDIFQKLVPLGSAQLVMLRNLSALEESANSATANGIASVSLYTGIAVQVSFNAKAQASMRMQQLSGGQKTIVSLALIFAIQKCDPAPFYLFDEIDANLDAAHRSSVAALIHEESQRKPNGAQFITTTFRPEMLTAADKFYGVSFAHRVSRIDCISKEAALEFIHINESVPSSLAAASLSEE